MSVRADVERLEKRFGDSDSPWCTCSGEPTIAVNWDTDTGKDPEAEPTICPRCGKPIKRVVIKWPDD